MEIIWNDSSEREGLELCTLNAVLSVLLRVYVMLIVLVTFAVGCSCYLFAKEMFTDR
jgi:hypothetical protein